MTVPYQGPKVESLGEILPEGSTIPARQCVSLAALLLVAGTVLGQNSKLGSVLDMSEFVRDWQISKTFTLNVANAMPADLYAFKPNSDEMNFGEQMVHIAVANVFRFNQITGAKPPFSIDLAKPPASDKETVLKVLDQSFDYVVDLLPRITPEQLKRTWHISSWADRPNPDGRAMIVNMLVHTAHHRAQCEVYMRAKGLKPPDYEF